MEKLYLLPMQSSVCKDPGNEDLGMEPEFEYFQTIGLVDLREVSVATPSKGTITNWPGTELYMKSGDEFFVLVDFLKMAELISISKGVFVDRSEVKNNLISKTMDRINK